MSRFLLIILLVSLTYSVSSAALLIPPERMKEDTPNNVAAVAPSPIDIITIKKNIDSITTKKSLSKESNPLPVKNVANKTKSLSPNAKIKNETANSTGLKTETANYNSIKGESINKNTINNGTEEQNTIKTDSEFRPGMKMKQDITDSRALLRGFYVFLGLSALTLLYVVYRSYRLRRGGHRPTAVRKYGVLAQRTDMEMLPLPLDDDDDDDTVFEVGNQANR